MNLVIILENSAHWMDSSIWQNTLQSLVSILHHFRSSSSRAQAAVILHSLDPKVYITSHRIDQAFEEAVLSIQAEEYEIMTDLATTLKLVMKELQPDVPNVVLCLSLDFRFYSSDEMYQVERLEQELFMRAVHVVAVVPQQEYSRPMLSMADFVVDLRTDGTLDEVSLLNDLYSRVPLCRGPFL